MVSTDDGGAGKVNIAYLAAPVKLNEGSGLTFFSTLRWAASATERRQKLCTHVITPKMLVQTRPLTGF